MTSIRDKGCHAEEEVFWMPHNPGLESALCF